MKIKAVQKMIAVMCAASISGSCVVTTVGALDDRELVAVAQGGSATNEDLAEAQVLQEEYDVKQAIKASEEEKNKKNKKI